MTPFKKLLKPYSESGELNSVLGPHRFVGNHVFLNKNGSLGIALRLRGIDYECLTDESLASNTSRLLSALKAFDEEFRIYQYVVKQGNAKIPNEAEYPTPRIGKAVEQRNRFLESRGLFSVELYWVILLERSVIGKRKPRLAVSTPKVLHVVGEHLERDTYRLEAKAKSFVTETADLLRGQLLDKHETFRFLRQLVNLDPAIAESLTLRHDAHVDYFLPAVTTEIERSGIRIGQEFVEVLSMKEAPRETRANFFEELYKIPANFILCTEFKAVSKYTATNEISKAQSHHYWAQYLRNPFSLIQIALSKGKKDDMVPDAAAKDNVSELDDLAKVLNQGDNLGQFSCTLLFHGPTREGLQESVSESVKLFGRYESSVFRETLNAFNAYLSIIPGNQHFSLRQQWLLQSSYADCSLVFARSKGEERNSFLNTEYLFPAETNDKTVHYVNLHHGDVCNLFLSGVMGAGKSVLSNMCIESFQKIGARVCVLDVGGSYRHICQRYEGSYVHFDFEKQDFFINPFVLPKTRANIRFLCAFLRLLLVNNEYKPNLEDNRRLYDAVCEIYERPESERRLSNLKLGKQLRAELQNWIGSGEDAWLFDNAQDTIHFSKFQVFDFQGADDEDYARVLEPLLFYLFRRQTDIVHDAALRTTFKLLWADEVWRFLANDTCRRKFIAAGKTYRKHNAGIGLVTQSAADLSNVGLLDIANEVCPTKIWLYNPGADVKEYKRIFKWNDKEAEQFSTLVPKRDFLLKKGDQIAQRLQLNLDPEALARFGNSPFSNVKRDEAIAKYGFERGLQEVATHDDE
jgi:type IV secretion/conjugal transfer VirB4 family ATPase